MRPLYPSVALLILLTATQTVMGTNECDSVDLALIQATQFQLVSSASPNTQMCTHNSGNMLLSVSNFGCFGSEFGTFVDCETNQPAISCEFPAGSRSNYLAAAGIWVGAIVGDDTLVSTGYGSRLVPGG